MTVFGCDISDYQSGIPSGVDFVISKCTEGVGYIAQSYKDRQQLVHVTGLIWGAYHFFRMSDSAGAQVQWFIDHANIQPGDFIALDFETVSYDSWGNYAAGSVAQKATDVMNLLRAAYPHNRILLYCDESTLTGYVQRFNIPVMDGLWVADYSQHPNTSFVLWQYSDTPYDKDLTDEFPNKAAMQMWAAMPPAGPVMYIPPKSTIESETEMATAGTNQHITVIVAGRSRLVMGTSYDDTAVIHAVDFWGSNASGWNDQPVGVGGHIGEFTLNPNMPLYVPLPPGAVIASVWYTSNHDIAIGAA